MSGYFIPPSVKSRIATLPREPLAIMVLSFLDAYSVDTLVIEILANLDPFLFRVAPRESILAFNLKIIRNEDIN